MMSPRPLDVCAVLNSSLACSGRLRGKWESVAWRPLTCNWEQRPLLAASTLLLMFSENTKTLLFLAWSIAVILGFIALGITSVLNWIVVAGVALAPPLVVRRFWRAPEQT